MQSGIQFVSYMGRKTMEAAFGPNCVQLNPKSRQKQQNNP